jgi:diaminopimelate decarboxylase
MTVLGRLLPMRAQPVPSTDGTRSEPASLAGPTCTPLDILGQDVPLSDLDVGKVIAIPDVGAYGLSASLTGFLSRPIAAEVVVAGNRVVEHSRWELRRVTRDVAS